MAGDNAANNSGRVTTRELYNALQEINKNMQTGLNEQNEARANMELRIMASLNVVSESTGRHDERIKKNDREIEKLRSRSNVNDIMVGVGAAIAAAISAVIGARN